jgi:hypothetical protein
MEIMIDINNTEFNRVMVQTDYEVMRKWTLDELLDYQEKLYLWRV